MEVFSPEFANNYELTDIESIFDSDMNNIKLTEKDLELMDELFNKSHERKFASNKDYEKFIPNTIRSQYNKAKLIHGYRMLLKQKRITRNANLERYMRIKVARGNSGVVVITIFMSGSQFGDRKDIKRGGCPENCHYCPFERDADGVPTQPRSYLSNEPGNMRATQNKHHPLGQLFARALGLEKQGHISAFPDVCSKVEIIISGGTFNFYPEDYIRWFVCSTYYAMNIYYDYKTTGELREMLSLAEEQRINETAALRMIGLTIETRPDRITLPVVQFFRELGITRVQIGVQHTDDAILAYVNRNCTNAQNKAGIRILKENGFKTDIHLMLDLPMPTAPSTLTLSDFLPEHQQIITNIEQELGVEIPREFKINALRDLAMAYEVIHDPDMQADQWKIYPTETTPFTKILEWYESGRYKPYAEWQSGILLNRVIAYTKSLVHPYIRINRVVRDIPTVSILGGISNPGMRNDVYDYMSRIGTKCRCIRCREVKDQAYNADEPCLFVHEYRSSSGSEYFITFENHDQSTLYGLCRLRFNMTTPTPTHTPTHEQSLADPILANTALIRELHVYGIHSGVGDSSDSATTHTQHKGLGTKLLQKAEEIAAKHGYNSITVIAGVGVKEYYRKFGYSDYHTYLRKTITPISQSNIEFNVSGMILFMFVQLFAMLIAIMI
jgi:elongator complex protein 3